MISIREVFIFPRTVDNYTTRTVVSLAAVLSIVTIVVDLGWMIPMLVAGFAARVFTGTTLCPFSHLSKRVITPVLKIPEEHVDGPPKRFTQIIGLVVLTVLAILLYFLVGYASIAFILVGIVLVFELLEAIFRFCAGCFLYAQFKG